MKNLPSWLQTDGAITPQQASEAVTALDYETYSRIERDIREHEPLAFVVMALATLASAPTPKGVNAEVFNSMRAAQIAKIVVNFKHDVYQMQGSEE